MTTASPPSTSKRARIEEINDGSSSSPPVNPEDGGGEEEVFIPTTPEEDEARTSTSAYQQEAQLMQTVHIVCRVRDVNGGGNHMLSGKLKSKPEDFHVNEIARNGTIVRMSIPPMIKKRDTPSLPTATTTTSSEQQQQPTPQQCVSNLVQFLSLPPQDETTLQDVVRIATTKGDYAAKDRFWLSLTLQDKDYRQKIHEAIRTYVGQWVVSKTDAQRIQVIPVTARILQQEQRRARTAQQRDTFTTFVLWKCNMDLNHALSEISRKLHIPRKSLLFAGTKDKVGITTQELCVKGLDPTRLNDVVSDDVGIVQVNSNAAYALSSVVTLTPRALTLGDSQGNHFSIVIRDVSVQGVESNHKDTITHICSEVVNTWSQNGFVNYFGLQRFGTTGVLTHHVGIAILRREWDHVVNLILDVRSGEDAVVTAVRKALCETRDITTFLHVMPARFTAERSLVDGLRTYGWDKPVQALEKIPRNLQTMYLHAYQSFIFNAAVTERLTKHGATAPVIGDLVIKKTGNDYQESRKKHPIYVSSDNISQFTIFDVVLPLPGFDVMYPMCEGVDVNFYREMLKKDGLEMSSLRNDKLRTYSISGDYRHIVLKPANVEHAVRFYTNPKCDLLAMDGSFMSQDAIRSGSGGDGDGEEKVALLLSFSIPAGIYATMAVREMVI